LRFQGDDLQGENRGQSMGLQDFDILPHQCAESQPLRPQFESMYTNNQRIKHSTQAV